MGKLVLKIINVVTTALVAIIVAFALVIVVGKPFGFHAYTVLSGSMEPAYHTGSLIYVKETPTEQLASGDVITFMTGKGTTVTHRIASEVEGADGVTRFETKGDANSTADGDLVHPNNVIGTPVLQIPLLGRAVDYIQHPPGLYVAISICAFAVFLMFLPDLFAGDEDEEEGRRPESAEGRATRGGSNTRTAMITASHAKAAHATPAGPHVVNQAGHAADSCRATVHARNRRNAPVTTGANNPRLMRARSAQPVIHMTQKPSIGRPPQ